MFRAAFPTCTDVDEKRETTYAKTEFDLTGNNGSAADTAATGIIRLAGTWVTKDQASKFAIEYGISTIIDILANARPDPKKTYTRPGQTPAVPIPTTSRHRITLDPEWTPPATKRRREEAKTSLTEESKAASPVPGVRTTRRTTPQVKSNLSAAKATSPPPRRSSRN